MVHSRASGFALALVATVLILLSCSPKKGFAEPGVLAGDGSGWSDFIRSPPPQGRPEDYGHKDEAIARWDTVPWQTVGPGETLHIGIVAFHQATAAEQIAGAARPVAGSNIARVSVSVDGGTWSDVALASTNADEGVWEYNFDVRASDFADGPHEARAIIYPATGRPVVLQGPSHVNGDQGSIASATLVLLDARRGAGAVSAGMSVAGVGVEVGTLITGPCTDNGTVTTCPVTPSQTVATTDLRLGETPGLPFFTNGHRTKPSAVRYVGPAGVDSTSCGAKSSAPCLTINRAINNAYSDHKAVGNDAGGATVCVQAGDYSTMSGAFAKFPTATRWLSVIGTGHGPCDSRNAEPATVTGFDVDMGITHLHVAYMNFRGSTTTGGFNQTGSGAGDESALWLDHINYTGASWQRGSVAHINSFTNGIFCTESTITNVADGCDGALIARNMTESWMASDAFQYAHMIVNSKVTNATTSPGRGDTVSGSPIVRNFTGAAHVAVGDCIYNATHLPDGTCIVSIDGSTQITLNRNAAATGVAVRFDAGIDAAHGEHPDIWQQAAFSYNWIAYGLDASGNLDPQGLFPNGSAFSQAVVNSKFQTNPGGHVMQVGGPQTNWFWAGNQWVGSLIWAPGPYVDVLVYRNTCSERAAHPKGITVVQSPGC